MYIAWQVSQTDSLRIQREGLTGQVGHSRDTSPCVTLADPQSSCGQPTPTKETLILHTYPNISSLPGKHVLGPEMTCTILEGDQLPPVTPSNPEAPRDLFYPLSFHLLLLDITMASFVPSKRREAREMQNCSFCTLCSFFPGIHGRAALLWLWTMCFLDRLGDVYRIKFAEWDWFASLLPSTGYPGSNH